MRFWQRQRAFDRSDIFLQEYGMVELCLGLGLPEALITPYTTLYCVPNCFIEVYTDGQVFGYHAPFDTPEFSKGFGALDLTMLNTWFGQYHYDDGQFKQRLAEVRDGNLQVDGVDLMAMQTILGELYAKHLLANYGLFPRTDPMKAFPPLTRVEGDGIYLGGNFGQRAYDERLSHPPTCVLDIAPGLRAVHQMDQIIEIATRNRAAPFQYLTINRHPFPGSVIMNYLKLKGRHLTGSDDLVKLLYEKGQVVCFGGELAVLTQDLINIREQDGDPPGFIDLAFYVSGHPPVIDASEAEALLRNLHRLLALDGMLVMGFPAGESTPGHVSLTELVSLAMRQMFFLTRGHTGLPQDRLPTYMVFTKG